MAQDNRLLPLTAVDRTLDRPLTEFNQSKPYGISPAESAHLREYLFVILKRKWLVLTLMLVITSLVAIQMYRMPSIYEAVATVQIEPKRNSILQTGKEIVINTAADTGDPIYRQTQLKLLESPSLARQVILTLDLQHNPSFLNQSQGGMVSTLRRVFNREKKTGNASTATQPPGLSVVNETKGQELSSQELENLETYEDIVASNLEVVPVTGTNLVELHYKHTDPDLAKKIADAYGETFASNNMEQQTRGSQEAGDLLAKKIIELQQTIRQQEEERFNYVKNNDLPQTTAPTGSNLSLDRLAMLSKQLLEAENERKNLEAVYNAANKESDPVSIPEVQENKRIQSLREKLDTLKQKREELRAIYTDEWPEVKKINAQIEPLEEALAKAPREVVSAMKTRYEAAVARENSLRAEYNRQKGETTQQNLAMIQLSVRDQELETNKQSLATLLQKQRELENVSPERLKTNNISVTQYSRRANLIGPPRLRNILLAFLLSLAAGIGLAFLLDYLDDTLKSVEDVDRYLHLPALALIPSSRIERGKLRGKAASLAGGGPATDSSAALALIEDVRSPITEAYRHLRTSLLLSSAGQPPKTILVTSSQPSEGKTTTAINTAVMLAQTGAEVIIVDCDLRRPRLHAHFHIPNSHGVTNYLSGESNLDALIQDYEQLPNLKLMTAGPVPPNPAELLSSEEMRKLLQALSERYAHIIVDSPPTISFTDSSILSTMVDGVVLVVHGGRSSRAVVRRAKQQLLDVGANIFGIVLNNVKLESTGYYYYTDYYYSQSYYAEADERETDGAHEEGAAARGSRA